MHNISLQQEWIFQVEILSCTSAKNAFSVLCFWKSFAYTTISVSIPLVSCKMFPFNHYD